MCPGNENMTPPATMLYLKENGNVVRSHDPAEGERPHNWLVRVIPNLYPAFGPPRQPQDTGQIMVGDDFGYAIGHHEVIVETPIHEDDPADTQLPQLELVVEAYVDRLKELSAKPYVKYVSIFRNFGIEAGASLSHAHSQVIATPIVPTTIKEEQEACRLHYDQHGTCAFCDIIGKELNGPRLIHEDDNFVVFAPYASIGPMAFWIAPKRHAPNILNFSPSDISAFARTLKISLTALKTVVNDPPYNYGFHLSTDSEDQNSYHWHLEVYPKLSTWAGFELTTGMYINTVTPETAAESLRKALKP